MIYVTGYGQMCNNMLQFGHFYAFGKEFNLPTTGMRFCYKYPYFNISNQKGYHFFNYIFAKYMSKLKLIEKIDFNDENEDLSAKINLLKTRKLVLADGWYFRQYELFLKYRADIKVLFDFNASIKNKVDTHLPASSKIRIGLHVRRGDYARWHDGKFFLSDLEYANLLRDFINTLNTGTCEIVIVTNDKNLDLACYESQTGQKINLLNGNPAEDLYLLSTCNYIIGPPSTFSLMAAFYEDRDLYWIFDKGKSIEPAAFKKFDHWFRKII